MFRKWSPKVTTIQEGKDLTTLSMEQLIASLMTHEILVDSKEESIANNKEMVLKVKESEEDEDDISHMARRFKK